MAFACNITTKLTPDLTKLRLRFRYRFPITNCSDFLTKVVSSWSAENWGRWHIAAYVAVPIVMLCILGVVVFLVYFVRKWNNKYPTEYPYEEDLTKAPDQQPILSASSLRDMIEMTTSGSGSGIR